MHKTIKLTFISLALTTASCTLATPTHFDVQQEALSAHNKFRARHHAPKLVWDDTLAKFAVQYATHCQFKHSHSHYGENIAMGYPSAAIAIQRWYDEQAEYSYFHPGFSKTTGHFTQLVWKSSKKLGCGYVACDGKNGTLGKFLVCEYSPAGNVVNHGYFTRNVLPAE